MDILVIISLIITALSAWAQIKGGDHVIETSKAVIQKMIDWQIISKTKVQEVTSFLSSKYENLLNRIKSNKSLLLGITYGILLSLLVFSLIAVVRYIKTNGIEEILSSLQFSYEKEPTLPNVYGGINININVINLLWLFVFIFGVIGAIRGWTKELLVIFGVITALAVNLLLEKHIPLVRDLDKSTLYVFWIRITVLLATTYFGYKTVSNYRFENKAMRERLQDTFFGSVFGGVNGYLIFGSILYYFDFAGYPYPEIISPATDPKFLLKIDEFMSLLPPQALGEPGIYFVLVLLLIFILVVYV